ncbi:copper resistance protein CopC [Streptomyces niveus]|uniref:copper resistance protein CopC n=1 Tax=Streptomyces niveus TaxID=193462 RepID=UPI0034199046
MKPGLPAGSYTVGYRVVSADGHPVTGSYRPAPALVRGMGRGTRRGRGRTLRLTCAA